VPVTKLDRLTISYAHCAAHQSQNGIAPGSTSGPSFREAGIAAFDPP
jgi:hypothetical protein